MLTVWALLAVAALLALAAVPIAILASSQGQRQEDRARAAEGQAAAVAEAAAPAVATVDELCRSGDPTLITELQERGACVQAARARDAIQTPVVTVSPGGPTSADVQRLIDERVAGLPRPLSVRQVTDIAVDVYTRDPAVDGRDATPEMVAAAVTAYCAGGGCVGEDGQDAPPPTADEIAAQVTAYCATRRECSGPEGRPGISFLRLYFDWNDGTCVAYVDSVDPFTGTVTTASTPTGPAACPPVPEPTTTAPLLPVPTS
jgi:hypothetical protein